MLHIVGFDTIDEAIEIFNDTQYALTGGIYCQSQNDLDYILPKLEVGNIYVNRPNTGARVAIEPFGGFKKSGTGPKAGGRNYLNTFVYNRNAVSLDTISIDDNSDKFGQFDCARNSKRDFESRKQIVKRLLQRVMLEKEVLFQSEGYPFLVWPEKFYESLVTGELDLKVNTYPNQYIPGQMSFDKKDLGIGHGVIIDAEKKIHMSMFLDFLLNILAGNGLNIICLNSQSYNHWKEILNMAYKCGLSIYNASVSNLDLNTTVKVLQSYSFKFLILPREDYDHEIIRTFYHKTSEDYLPKIVYSKLSGDVASRVDNFVHTRSFAVNTMRHGAPLELEI